MAAQVLAKRGHRRPFGVDLSNMLDPASVRCAGIGAETASQDAVGTGLRKSKRKSADIDEDEEIQPQAKKCRYNLRSQRGTDVEEEPGGESKSENGDGGGRPVTRSRTRKLEAGEALAARAAKSSGIASKARSRSKPTMKSWRGRRAAAATRHSDGEIGSDKENSNGSENDEEAAADDETGSTVGQAPASRSVALDDCDVADCADELASAHYAGDITNNMFRSETMAWYAPTGDYMCRQADLSKRMRIILLDWILDVHRKFELSTATLYLCVNLLDRYLATQQVQKNRLQLTGCACLWVASKYHEIYAPEMHDFVYISDDAFTSDDLTAAEAKIVSALEFNITAPTPLSFLQRFLKVLRGKASGKEKDKAYKAVQNLSYYIAEHALMSYELSTDYTGSQVAAACVAYASLCMRYECKWPLRMQRVTRCTLRDLKGVLAQLDGILKTGEERCKHKAVRKKYSHRKFGQISRYEYLSVNCDGWIDERASAAT